MKQMSDPISSPWSPVYPGGSDINTDATGQLHRCLGSTTPHAYLVGLSTLEFSVVPPPVSLDQRDIFRCTILLLPGGFENL